MKTLIDFKLRPIIRGDKEKAYIVEGLNIAEEINIAKFVKVGKAKTVNLFIYGDQITCNRFDNKSNESEQYYSIRNGTKVSIGEVTRIRASLSLFEEDIKTFAKNNEWLSSKVINIKI